MASRALGKWHKERLARLDEFEGVHLRVRIAEGLGRGGRTYLTEQVNHAYLLAVAAQFQAFCRDLHSEAAQFVASLAVHPHAQATLLLLLTQKRALDQGNAHPGSLGEDFNRLAPGFIDAVKAGSRANERRLGLLNKLNAWRNALAHAREVHELAPAQQQALLGTRPTLRYVRKLRRNCEGLVLQLDRILKAQLRRIVGQSPW